MKKLTDKQKIELLAKKVLFAVKYLKGTGSVFNIKTGECEGHWLPIFCKALRDCGFQCDDDAVRFVRTPMSQRRGPVFKALVKRLKDRGFKGNF